MRTVPVDTGPVLVCGLAASVIYGVLPVLFGREISNICISEAAKRPPPMVFGSSPVSPGFSLRLPTDPRCR